MNSKPSTCVGCPIYDTGKGFVPDEVVPKAELVFVSDAPDKAEIHQGKLGVGSGGFVLKAWGLRVVPTLQLLHEKKKVAFCNVLKCLPPEQQGKNYPSGDTKARAEAHCAQYMDLGKPKTVVLLGAEAQRRFFPKELADEDAVSRALGHDVKGVLGRVGRVYERDGVRYVFSIHPSSALKQPAFVSHLQEALKIAAGQERMVETDVMVWEKALMELG